MATRFQRSFRLGFFLLVVLVFPLSSSVAQKGQSEPIGALSNRLELLKQVRTSGWEGQQTAQKVREILAGLETNAVAYSLEKYGADPNDVGLNRICMSVLLTFEKQTLDAFQLMSDNQLDHRSRNLLVHWARTTKLPEALNFAVEHSIDLEIDERPQWDTEKLRKMAVEMDTGGGPYRLCDLACNLIVDRIAGIRKEIGNKPPLSVSTMDSFEVREKKRKLLREWWKKNKDFLQWSEKEGKFVVNQDAKNVGTLKGSRPIR